MWAGSSCREFGRPSLRWKCVPFSSHVPYSHYNHNGCEWRITKNNEVYFIWIILGRILDDTGKAKNKQTKNYSMRWNVRVKLCRPRAVSCCLSLTHTASLALLLMISECCVIHFNQLEESCILFKEHFLIFECICFFEVILLNFFLTCVNTTECVVFKKVPSLCTPHPQKALL